MKGINAIIRQYGGTPESLLHFDSEGPALLPYATLTAARGSGDPDLAAVGGVYEWQDRPLLFLVDGSLLDGNERRLNRIRRLVAMRGDAPYLAVVTPGRLTVYHISLDADTAQARVAIDQAKDSRSIVIPHLANLRPQLSANQRWITDVILKLLSNSLDHLAGLGIIDEDAISLVGRALFVRFLADRELLPRKISDRSVAGAASLFDDPASAVAVSAWLDETFNGDFLPLTATVIDSLPNKAFNILGNILRRAPDNQLALEWQEKWEMLDFAHIPVGVLSQAYERYLSQHEPEMQRTEGGYYTPRHIADLMVRATFAALGREGETHAARVLDPAAGAGVFLLTAFRQLVGARWSQDKRRPDTKTLREILYKQITGFDINESALRFAALGLYLMSIELDPHPEPLKKLRFKNLRPAVLRKLGERERGVRSRDLGSLGDEVGSEHDGAYDLVIGNPPWATSTQLSNWSSLQDRIGRIARTRLQDEMASAPLPNEVLDLPFVWRAMEWARPGGQIAFALHARILFLRGEGMSEARNALLGALDVTGIVNGAELRATRVWPGVTAPFCLLFARNAVPSAGSGFRFLSPSLEGGLNSSGAWRIDAANAEIVNSDEARRRPELLKILFRGTRLDLELYDRIAAKNYPSLKQYWVDQFGLLRGRPRYTGNGYQRLRESSRISKGGDGKPGQVADHLHNIPELSNSVEQGILIDTSALDTFNESRVHRGRPRELFRGPLLLVGESPPVQYGRIRTSVAPHDVVFTQSYHGYSTRTHEYGDELARYLALIIGSKIALWHALITSGRFGFEREVVEKFVIDELPIPPFEKLSKADRAAAASLFDALVEKDDEAAWQRVDRWADSLFGLTSDDGETIADTLDYRLPFAANRKIGQKTVGASQFTAFKTKLETELFPWAQRFNQSFTVDIVPSPHISPWHFVRLAGAESREMIKVNDIWMRAVRVADELSATEIIYVDEEGGGLVIGRLNQARYWTRSQAKLVARRVIWDHIDFLSGKRTK